MAGGQRIPAPRRPQDFYARLAARLKPRGIRLVLDSSGEGLSRGWPAAAFIW